MYGPRVYIAPLTKTGAIGRGPAPRVRPFPHQPHRRQQREGLRDPQLPRREDRAQDRHGRRDHQGREVPGREGRGARDACHPAAGQRGEREAVEVAVRFCARALLISSHCGARSTEFIFCVP